MIIFPAIDLKQGECVRLKQGDMNKATVFNSDPVAQARQFKSLGFDWLHVVDLDGAVKGRSENSDIVKSILSSVDMAIQLGGGIRDLDAIESWLDLGVKRVILGTAAVNDPELVKKACNLYPGKIVVGIDARGGKVSVQGWSETSELDVITLAKRFEGEGVAAIIYTDINRDGVFKGVDLEGTAELAQAISIPVIASGGVASLDDISSVRSLSSKGVVGVVVGRAFYEGKIDIQRARELI